MQWNRKTASCAFCIAATHSSCPIPLPRQRGLQPTDGTDSDLPASKLRRNVIQSFARPRHEFRAMNFCATPKSDFQLVSVSLFALKKRDSKHLSHFGISKEFLPPDNAPLTEIRGGSGHAKKPLFAS